MKHLTPKKIMKYNVDTRRETVKIEKIDINRIHLIKYNGKVQTLAGWAKDYGLCPRMVANRIRRGWSFEQAITIPPLKKHKAKARV